MQQQNKCVSIMQPVTDMARPSAPCYRYFEANAGQRRLVVSEWYVLSKRPSPKGRVAFYNSAFLPGIGRFVSHKYGYGVIDTARLVYEAKLWHNVGPQVQYSSTVKVRKVFVSCLYSVFFLVFSDRQRDLPSSCVLYNRAVVGGGRKHAGD
jgi:hypothetical protein